ncbi:Crp/Fnr family transcriptional regulator [Sabulilitoribacter multivorans]|uniref:Crp/Fnr family transcriptional regulator n=1 Tax=Flaviramulus multivorans TaxID=1304750 RepID=A0ABS9IH06_9FLAO|nr:Crp/Fnr family transcriptional regulator [Flaviramulus multivorans]MCF7560051.1 Crp/Fnr family transcriptional regulator [Flaviramulus multivorans]
MNPNELHVNFLNSFSSISERNIEELLKITELKSVKGGTQIVKLNEVPSKVYMLVSGVIRCFLSTESGKEFNKSFYLPFSFVGPVTALIQKKPSLFVFEALTDCEIYEVDYYKLMDLCKKDESLNMLYAKVLETVYMTYEKRLVELISLDAKNRYIELKRQIPDVEYLIPQYHIASYLGITAVQLSRIRKKIAKD